MSNNSASGGYLLPAPPSRYPGNLTFKQFLQTVFTGISGLPAELVRGKWQIDPPKQPDVTVNWLSIGLGVNRPDANEFVGVNPDGSNFTQRHEDLEVKCSFMGPESDEIASATRDGFSITQNLENLRAANMGFVNTSEAVRVPDLVNERWQDRYEMSVFLRRERLRVYPILTFVSASGTIYNDVGLKPIAFAAG